MKIYTHRCFPIFSSYIIALEFGQQLNRNKKDEILDHCFGPKDRMMTVDIIVENHTRQKHNEHLPVVSF